MNRKELSQLYYLKREIANDEQRLIELESAATSITSKLNGFPGGGRRSDKTAIAAEIADLKAILNAKHEMCIAHYNKLTRYVMDIDDSLMRHITYRCIDLMKWRQIAQKIGGGNTEEGVRKAYARFVERLEKSS